MTTVKKVNQATPSSVPANRFMQWYAKWPTGLKVIVWFILIGLGLFLFSERSLVATPVLIALRKYAPVSLVLILFLIGLYFLIARKSKAIGGVVIGIILTLFILLPVLFGVKPWELYGFVSSYVRYETLDLVELSSLPETDHEAIQPKISIHTSGEQELQQSEQMSLPHRVRIGNRYPWTMVKQPSVSLKYARARLFDGIKKVYCISAETSSLDFSKENQSDVDFAIGETLLLGEETEIAVMRALPMSYLFNTELGEPRFMKNDKNEWVQVVPLIRWRGKGLAGIFFPQPEFGGVHVITQDDGHVSGLFVTKAFWYRAFLGAGTTYTPQQMESIPFLRNQNLMPSEIKEAIAKSFRFQKGFTAPIYASHDGDTRIPHIDEGLGSLPVTAYFKMSRVDRNASDMLYDYFSLEPYDTLKSGLMVSLYIPSDGRPQVYVLRHTTEDAISGISTVTGAARESRQSYDWQQSKVADVRPFTKVIDGKAKHFWLFSLVTRANNKGYTSGPASDVGLLDPVKKRVYWVSPDSSGRWMTKLGFTKSLAQSQASEAAVP